MRCSENGTNRPARLGSQPIESRGRHEQMLNARLDLPSGTSVFQLPVRYFSSGAQRSISRGQSREPGIQPLHIFLRASLGLPGDDVACVHGRSTFCTSV